MLVAVTDADLEERPQRDAGSAGQGDEPEQRTEIERRAATDGLPHVRPRRPVRVPRAEPDDTGNGDAAGEEQRPSSPAALVDGDGERDGDQERRADDDDRRSDEEDLSDEEVELVALVRGLTHVR